MNTTYLRNKKTKILSVLLAAMLVFTCVFCLAACKDDQPNKVDFYLPDGTPALAVASILASKADFSSLETNFEIVTADMISTAFSALGAEIAVMPTVVAAKLYKNGQDLKILSANVFGNLFMVGVNTEVASVEDLAGKVVNVTIGTTMDMLTYFLTEAGIDYREGSEADPDGLEVAINSVSDGSQIIAQLKQNASTSKEVLGVLGEPQVTKANGMIAELQTVLDFQAQWRNLNDYDGYPQACIVATGDFCKENADYIEKLLTALEGNSAYLTENFATLPTLFAEYESNLANMTFSAQTITNCNIRLERAQSAKEAIKTYISTLTPANTLANDLIFYGE